MTTQMTGTVQASPAAAMTVDPPPPPSALKKIGRWLAKLILPLWTALVILFLFTPIFFLIAMSFNEFKTIFKWTRFSTQWWGDMWSNTTMTDSVITSLEVAVVSTTIAVVLGTLAGVSLARKPGKWTVGFIAIVLLILVTPEIVDGAGELSWFVRLGGPFREGITPIVLAHTVFSSAVVTLAVAVGGTTFVSTQTCSVAKPHPFVVVDAK